jgi:hypothetical protein
VIHGVHDYEIIRWMLVRMHKRLTVPGALENLGGGEALLVEGLRDIGQQSAEKQSKERNVPGGHCSTPI